VQRLDKNRTLISFGKVISNDHILAEVINPSGEKIFDLKFADSLGSYRVLYFPSLPWKPDRPVIVKQVSGNGKLHLSTRQSYPGYRWSTGDTTREITVSSPGRYFVYVPTGDGGFIRSEAIILNRAPADRKKNHPGK
jgi:hypothetical protein